MIVRQHLVFVSVGSVAGARIAGGIRQRDTMFNAKAIDVIRTIHPIRFISGQTGAFCGIVVHTPPQRFDLIAEWIIFLFQSISG